MASRELKKAIFLSILCVAVSLCGCTASPQQDSSSTTQQISTTTAPLTIGDNSVVWGTSQGDALSGGTSVTTDKTGTVDTTHSKGESGQTAVSTTTVSTTTVSTTKTSTTASTATTGTTSFGEWGPVVKP